MVGQDRTPQYKENSLSLVGAVALGTGVMIGAGIFALTGQMAEMTGRLFPLAFLAAAVIVSFSAYSYVKMSNAYPSAGGIAMFLNKAYGRGVMTGACALLARRLRESSTRPCTRIPRRSLSTTGTTTLRATRTS